MPVDDYGVLKGSVVDFGREDSGGSPHFQIVILAGGNRFRVPVNVKSGDGSLVLFRLEESLANHRLLAEFSQLPAGFTADPSIFLDFLREPIFDITTMRV